MNTDKTPELIVAEPGPDGVICYLRWSGGETFNPCVSIERFRSQVSYKG